MSTKGIKLFKEILCGSFDNADQISEELKNGKIIHPYAQHVTDVINDRIDHLPDDCQSVFILEESYYDYLGKERIIKPLLFKISPNGNENIHLESIIIPDHYNKEQVLVANQDLRFNYLELKSNKDFGKASYNNHGEHFTVKHFCEFEGGVSFDFRETLRKNELHVMELYKKGDKQLTTYDTPIIYKRR